jgi:hypothetical protein
VVAVVVALWQPRVGLVVVDREGHRGLLEPPEPTILAVVEAVGITVKMDQTVEPALLLLLI